jgi:hypothetical protein
MRRERVRPLPFAARQGEAVERAFRRLPDEAVVSRAEDGTRLLSPCALVGEEAGVATQSADNNPVCIKMSPCSPRPRKRGTLHGSRPLSSA